MTTAHRLRQEATVLRATARTIWRDSEDLLDRATRLNADATQLEEQAEEIEELEQAREWIGGDGRLKKARAVA